VRERNNRSGHGVTWRGMSDVRVAVKMSQCGQPGLVSAYGAESAASVFGVTANLVLFRNCVGYHLHIACLWFSAVNFVESTKGRVTC